MKRGLVLGLLLLLGIGCIASAQSLEGRWILDIEINPQEVVFADAIDLDTVISVSYTISSWTFTSQTALDQDGWVDQDFSTTGLLGSFTLTSALDLNPDATFGSWTTTVGTTFAGAVLGLELVLQGNDTFLTLTGSGVSAGVSIDIDIEFGDDDEECDFPFSEFSIGLDFAFCCAEVSADVVFGCDGFDHITLATSGITTSLLPWLSIAGQLTYTLQTKSLTLSPSFDFGTVTCIDFYVSVATGSDPLSFGDISIDGIELSCDVGVVTFTGLSYWGAGGKPGLLAGKEYWEVYAISSNDDACCGPFSFDVGIYFLENGLKLFDISFFDLNMSIEISHQFTFDMGLEVDVEIGATIWTLGFDIEW